MLIFDVIIIISNNTLNIIIKLYIHKKKKCVRFKVTTILYILLYTYLLC